MVGLDTGSLCALLVPAGEHRAVAEGGPVEDVVAKDEERDGPDDLYRELLEQSRSRGQFRNAPDVEQQIGIVVAAYRRSLPLENNEIRAPKQCQRPDGDDERREPEFGYHQSLEQPVQGRKQEHQQHHEQNGVAGPIHGRYQRATDSHQRPDRQIEFAGDHQHGHPVSDDGCHRGVPNDADQIVCAEEHVRPDDCPKRQKDTHCEYRPDLPTL